MYTREQAYRILADGGWSDEQIDEAMDDAGFLGRAELDADWRILYNLSTLDKPFVITCAEPVR